MKLHKQYETDTKMIPNRCEDIQSHIKIVLFLYIFVVVRLFCKLPPCVGSVRHKGGGSLGGRGGEGGDNGSEGSKYAAQK